ncbi:MAG TPA: NHLP bacteriocin export ABC transporter permease/ATPase subunit [Chloroflexia bacterium]|nr:NHLP bacteriocin export ABC transporter permease/ATPase subunit [Chloroflexia bacterium]
MADKNGDGAADEPKGLELFLLKLRYKEGRLMAVEGNNPVLLDDPASAWVVYAGQIDVFVVQVLEGEPVGPRRHLFRAEPGYVLFGIPLLPGGSGIGLLASGLPGSRVLKVREPRFRALAADIENTEIVTGLVDSWISGLSQGIVKEIAPKEYVLLDAGKTPALKVGEVAIPRRGVLWVSTRSGSSQFLGRTELHPVSGDGYVPLSRYTWLQATTPLELATLDSATYFERDPEWSGLTAFHRLALDCILLNRQQEESAERDRLVKKAAAQRTVVESAFTQIAALLEPELANPFITLDGDTTDPLLTACRIVGRAADIRIEVALDGGRARSPQDALRAIANASNIRTRQVALRDTWWRGDNGPLLGFLDDGLHPVALLPTSPASYAMHDPVTRSQIPVTEAAAGTLHPFAHAFYRPFPHRPIHLRDLLAFGTRGARADLRLVMGLGLVAGLLATVPPVVTGLVFDNIIPDADVGQLVQVGALLLAIALVTAVFQITRSIAVLRIEGRMDASVEAALWDRLLGLPVPFFRDYSSGDLGQRAMGISAIRQALSGPVVTSLLASIFSVFNLVLLFVYSSSLAFVATGLVLLSMVITTAAGYLQVRYQRALVGIEGRLSGTVLQFINGIAKFRVAGAENRAFALWAREFTAQKHIAYKARGVANGLAVVNAAYPILTAMAIFAMFGASRDQGLSTGQFLAFNAAFGQLLFAGLQLSSAVISILSIVPTYERARPILETLPEVDRGKTHPGELTGAIEVNHVSFRYKPDGPLILKDVSLQIKPGEFVALVGSSGSGKSTLFRVLLGFERPESGAVYYDGQDLTGVDLRAVRQQIGVVLQNGKLLSGDIFQNIIGSSLATLDDAWEAARLAGFDDDIRAMPMGMHTMFSEGGGTLSGGQRQRLLIARAIVKKPRVLYFDEATSALDNRTQEIVSKSLENLQATRIVIAHRLSTIINADRIFVLDEGRVVQVGTYADLVDQPGLFAELAKRQIA